MSAVTRYHVDHVTAEPLLSRLEGVQKAGKGWRARCPACGGTSRKLSVAEVDHRVLLHCFAGCKAIEVLEAVGLSWGDLFPPRHWPETPEERRQARRAMRETGWAAALTVLSIESKVALIAAKEIAATGGLTDEDLDRLELSVERIGGAAIVLVEDRR